jgi:hypothetical protein
MKNHQFEQLTDHFYTGLEQTVKPLGMVMEIFCAMQYFLLDLAGRTAYIADCAVQQTR